MILYSKKKLYSWATTDSDFDPEKIDMQIGKVGEFIQIGYETSHNYVEKVKKLYFWATTDSDSNPKE